MDALPSTMQALELNAYDGQLHLVEKPIPRPGAGEVLIRMAAAPIHPSDLAFIQGNYGIRKRLPIVPGVEGSGTVVAAGSGVMPRLMLGRRVACASSVEQGGTWAEYMVTGATLCVPLLPSVSLEQGALLVVNPLTASVLVAMARRGRHKAAVNTAAASALGQMMLRLAKRLNYPLVHVVRRQAQVDLLRKLGADYVLNSSEPDFAQQSKDTFHKLGVTIAFDAIAGEMSGQLLDAMPAGGQVVVYGGLADAPTVQVGVSPLIFERKSVSGFWLPAWLASVRTPTVLKIAFEAQRGLAGDFQTPIFSRITLEQGISAPETYHQEMTKGKFLFVFR